MVLSTLPDLFSAKMEHFELVRGVLWFLFVSFELKVQRMKQQWDSSNNMSGCNLKEVKFQNTQILKAIYWVSDVHGKGWLFLTWWGVVA